MKFSKELIDKIKDFINNNNGKPLPNTFYKRFKGERMEFMTLEVTKKSSESTPKNKVYNTVYYQFPVKAYQQAMKSIKRNPMTPTKTIKTDATYGGQNVKIQFYKGKFKYKDIKDRAQRISDTLSQRGVQGFMSVSISFSGTIRRGRLTAFGEQVQLYDPVGYDFVEELPEYFDGFSISFIYQGKTKKRTSNDEDYNLNNLFD